ncbi:MAG: hypothetical protein SFY80_09535 [Verrucomicrobiota bacterium]|nr:hypothetical protein [Verrucomicrobiota bacterium]
MKPLHTLVLGLLIAGTLVAAVKVPSSSVPTQASEVIRIDDPIPQLADIQFPNPNRYGPEPSQFRMVAATPMSNELGERWALVTLYNPTGGKLELENNMIMATFANGDRSLALNLNLRVDARQNQSFAVSFGSHKFPIVLVETR